MYDIAIIGAGVIGAMTARELSRYKIKTVLLEKGNDVAIGATKANSGIVHGGYDPEPNTLKAELNTVGVDMLYNAAKELNVPCKNNGSLVVAFSDEQYSALEELLARGEKNSVKGLKIISGDSARTLEPNLSAEVTAALYVPNAGIVCPYELTIAAVGNAMDNGVELLRNFEVCAITEANDGFKLQSVGGEEIQSKYIVNCAGAHSDKVAKMIGDDSFKIIPRAGEYMLLEKEAGEGYHHTVFQLPTNQGKGILVTPTVDGNLLTGPTAAAVETPDSTQTTSLGLKTVERLAHKTAPNINFRQVITSFSGVRSSTSGGDFIIKPSDKNNRFIIAGGIDSPGLTCCVAIAKRIVSILTEQGVGLTENPEFNPIREDMHKFRKMDDKEKNEYIKKNPAFGRIVCRCETVSEGEIINAILKNPPALDVDGIKRRTRQGMGRCQGGFCLPTVLKLLSRYSGKSIENITKNGGESFYCTEKI